MGFDRRAIILQHVDDEVCKQSTAGGAFTAIGEYVISNGGIVFGVEIDKEHNVKHSGVEILNDLKKIRGSKYVQSNVGNSFRMIKECLDNGKQVCFAGTPCQVQGLRCYLQKDYTNLILVDVVCRAVPSPGVWKKYLQMIEDDKGKIDSVRFRDKKYGYQYSTMVITSVEGKEYRGGIENQPWLRMFFSGMIIRPACSECKFRHYKRNSDFTIWDCFPSYKFDKSFDSNRGTTRMLIHTEKGNAIFDSIRDRLCFTEVSVEKLINDVDEMKSSPVIPATRNDFYKELNCGGIRRALEKFFPNTFAIKIKVFARRLLNVLGIDVLAKRIIKKRAVRKWIVEYERKQD